MARQPKDVSQRVACGRIVVDDEYPRRGDSVQGSDVFLGANSESKARSHPYESSSSDRHSMAVSCATLALWR